ncbi:hypothetical protein [Rhizobium sp. SGZ-381]|uniref:hypothetical protein n=1 Tax=Rhizobium sp. SGZ-381 TaxID=3342800 RepID=UPI0036717684
MVNPYPLPRQLRETDALVGNGGSVYGPFAGFKIFDTADVEVWTRPDGADVWTEVAATVTKTTGDAFDTFSVTFPYAVPATTRFKVLSRRTHERTAGVENGTRLDMTALEKELSKQGTVLQELRRDVDRGVQVQFGPGYVLADDLEDGETLMKSGTRLVAGPNAADIASAQSYAEIALTSSEHAQASAEEAAGYADLARNDWVVSGPFTGTGAEQDYLLAINPGSVNNMFLSAGGVLPLTTSYELVAVSGSYYLRATVPDGVVFEVRSGYAIDVNTPSAGSVTRASLATSATLEGQIAAATDAAFSDTDMLIARKSDGSSVKRSWGNVKSALSTGKARFRAHKNNVNQAGIVSATDTKLTFTTEASDFGGFYDAATSKWTPPAGAVFLNSVCQITGTFSATVQVAYLQIFKNGTLFATGASVHDANTGNTAVSVTCTDDANGSDFYEVYLNVTTASGTATVTGTIAANRFEGIVI